MAKASEIVALATRQVGTCENPPGSNQVRYNTWYYGREVSGAGYPWCMTFMQWLAAETGLSVLRVASCTKLADWAKERRQWVTKEYQVGDWVMFDFTGRKGKTEHVGLVVEAKAGGVVSIEGNTGAGNDANGGQVQKRMRANGLITGAWRPAHEEEKRMEKMDNTPGEYAKAAVAWAQKEGILKGDAGGNLKLHEGVTREQLMVFLYRTRKL